MPGPGGLRRAFAAEALEQRLMLAAGDLDESFSVDGRVLTGFDGYSGGNRALAVALQSDGKIVAAGGAGEGPASDFAVARYNRDGTLDQTFGGGTGRVTVAPFALLGLAAAAEYATSVAVQTDGRIILAGIAETADNRVDWTLCRLSSNGSVDTSFGRNGATSASFRFFDMLSAVRLDTQGRIVCAGWAVEGGQNQATVARILPTGLFDTTFNQGLGYTILGPGELSAVAIQPDGKIVAGGNSGGHFALVRLNVNGTLDGNFGLSGRVSTNFYSSGEVNAIAIASDGRIWAAGELRYSSQDPDTGEDITIRNWALARYRTDGTLDPTFGSGGVGTGNFTESGVTGIALQPDGKAVLVGTRGRLGRFIVGRVRADNGTFDTSFGGGDGIHVFGFPAAPGSATANAVALQPDGRIVVAGSAQSGSVHYLAVARLHGDPTVVQHVFVGGSGWATAFRTHLQARGLGGTLGFVLPTSGQGPPLPWVNLNQVTLRFNLGVTVRREDLSVRGRSVAAYPVSGFAYDASARTATWTLGRTIPNDRVTLALNAAVTGAAASFAFNVLPGDTSRSGTVLANDASEVKAKFFTSTASPGSGAGAYSVYHDVDGSGGILATDFSEVKRRFFSSLPAAVFADAPVPLGATRTTARPSRRGVLDLAQLVMPG